MKRKGERDWPELVVVGSVSLKTWVSVCLEWSKGNEGMAMEFFGVGFAGNGERGGWFVSDWGFCVRRKWRSGHSFRPELWL